MAKGRTISASFLTEKDRKIIELCQKISNTILDILPEDSRKRFKNDFGKISFSRDAGLGLGGGKLQRDGLCTRGISGKAPFSNRNLRWHPLVASESPISFAKEVERIEIEGEDHLQTLVFVVKNGEGIEQKYSSEKVHELPERFVALPEHWLPHIDRLKFWDEILWTQNSCIITAYEACNWQDAVESYAVLGVSVANNFFSADSKLIYEKVFEILANQTVDAKIISPSPLYPSDISDIINCPLCKVPASENLAKLIERKRENRWKPSWSGNKRGEGEDSSMQIMHVQPLTESEIRHNAQNVRFGHRWCNVAMTDHSVEETVDFMEYIVKAHNRI